MEGGRIMYEGLLEGLVASGTDTGRMLEADREFNPAPLEPAGWLRVENARLHNLKGITVDFPLGVLTVVAGVAGSGKSSLIQCLMDSCPQQDDIEYISQKNIGASLRSTPATYMGVADDIRKIFAKENKVSADWFAFNSKGGCPVCGGKGVIVSEMAFMDSVETVCEACGGLRYSPEALQYRIRGEYNIAQVMDMTVRAASRYFAGTVIEEKLRPLMDVGLVYLHLNQALSTLSGGELQRMKLASRLGQSRRIFILDEPTDGLHFKDVEHITRLFRSMVSAGNTVILVEHNTGLIKSADWLIELGPYGGGSGGELLYSGVPFGVMSEPRSVTRRYL